MYTTSVCVLFVCVLLVATPTSTISVYYFSICTLLKYVYCLWPLPHLVLVCTTLLQFICTTLVLFCVYNFSTIRVYYFSTIHVYHLCVVA